MIKHLKKNINITDFKISSIQDFMYSFILPLPSPPTLHLWKMLYNVKMTLDVRLNWLISHILINLLVFSLCSSFNNEFIKYYFIHCFKNVQSDQLTFYRSFYIRQILNDILMSVQILLNLKLWINDLGFKPAVVSSATSPLFIIFCPCFNRVGFSIHNGTL